MFNLNLGPAKNLAKAISYSSRPVGHGQGSSEQRRGGESFGPRYRSASFAIGNRPSNYPSDFVRVNNHEIDHGNEVDCDREEADPLMYRLQHQKQYTKEKEDKKRRSRERNMRRSISSRSCYRSKQGEMDPFDVWGSLTSEDTKGISTDDDRGKRSNVDVVGWGSRTSCSLRSSRSSEIDDDGGLMVDFGGVTPQDAAKRRTRTTSMPQYNGMQVDFDDTMEKRSGRLTGAPRSSEMHVDFGGVCLSDTENQRRRRLSDIQNAVMQVDFGGVTPPHMTMTSSADSAHELVPFQAPESPHPMPAEVRSRVRRYRPARRRSSDSSLGSNGFWPSKDLRRLSEGSGDCGASCPSQADLENMLSSLEDDVEQLSEVEPTEAVGPQSCALTALSCASSLSSPTEKLLQSRIPSSATPPEDVHISPPLRHKALQTSGPQCRQSTNKARRRPTPSKSLRQRPSNPPYCRPPEKPQLRPLNSPGCNQSNPSSSNAKLMPECSQSDPLKQQKQQQQQQQQQQEQKQLLPNQNETPEHSHTPQHQTEEDDPRLAQLKQQTTAELRVELPKLQAQSKTNLEMSWAEAERMRVENSELDEALAEARRKLAMARPSGHLRSPSFTSSNSGSRSCSLFSSGGHQQNSLLAKFRPPPSSRPGRRPRGRRRRRTISVAAETDSEEVISDISSHGGGDQIGILGGRMPQLKKSSSFNSLKDSAKSQTEKPSSRIRNSRSPGAFNGLMGRGTGVRRASSNSSGGGRRGFLAEIGQSFRISGRRASEGNFRNHSVGSNDLNIDLSFEDDSSNDERRGDLDARSRSLSIQDAMRRGSSDEERGTEHNSDAQSGVYFPTTATDENKSIAGSETCSVDNNPQMTDFDFDPFNENSALDNGSGMDKEERMGLPRRPSFLGSREENGKDEGGNTILPSFSPSRPLRSSKGNKVKTVSIQANILEKDREIKALAKAIKKQEASLKSREEEIGEANDKCGEDEMRITEEEATLRSGVGDLERSDSEIESKLDRVERLEEVVREREHTLKEELALISSEVELNSESQADLCRRQYENLQENAILSLSGVLDQFDAMSLPSLRGDAEEDDVSGDIIALFDMLTDREEELVEILCDTRRLASCQASFEQIQRNVEKAVYWQAKLGSAETDLSGYLVTIKSMLTKHEAGDEGTDTTESSTASERLLLERSFVEAVLSHLELARQNQGRPVLDALSESVEVLTHWDRMLLPDLASSSPDTVFLPTRSSGSTSLCAVFDTISRAKLELAEVKLDVLNEKAKFQSKMRSAGISRHPALEKGGVNFVSNAYDINNQGHDDIAQQLSRDALLEKVEANDEVEDKRPTKGVSQLLSAAEVLFSRREAMMAKHASLFGPMAQARASSKDKSSPVQKKILKEMTKYASHFRLMPHAQEAHKTDNFRLNEILEGKDLAKTKQLIKELEFQIADLLCQLELLGTM